MLTVHTATEEFNHPPPKKNPGHFGFVFEDICGREVV